MFDVIFVPNSFVLLIQRIFPTFDPDCNFNNVRNTVLLIIVLLTLQKRPERSSDLGKATHLESSNAPSGSNGSMIQVSLFFIPSLLLRFLSSFFFPLGKTQLALNNRMGKSKVIFSEKRRPTAASSLMLLRQCTNSLTSSPSQGV